MRFRFIDSHAGQYPVSLMCRMLGVSRAGYYAWRRRPPSRRTLANARLSEQIEAAYRQSRQTYGYRRVHAAVSRQTPCNHKRVARLMRQAGWQARRVRRYRTTTQARPGRPTAPNRLAQVFCAPAPNRTWLSDITYVPTAEGWLYLAVVLDLYSRQVVGWAMAPRLKDALTQDALQMALDRRTPPAGLVHHSDRGSQYTSQAYRALLAKHRLQASMSRTGNAYDNAPMESFFATLKAELVHHRRYRSRQEAMADIFEYMEVFYNRRRLHSALGYQTPVAYELGNGPP